jgi:ParB/RepB/Spo0J family partition protein
MLDELADSIAAVGVIQPIRVRRNPSTALGQAHYRIIAGERRWLASKKAGKDTIPAILVEDEAALTDDAIYAHQLTENLHRQDLNLTSRTQYAVAIEFSTTIYRIFQKQDVPIHLIFIVFFRKSCRILVYT